jgi:cytochrome c heme-lyase
MFFDAMRRKNWDPKEVDMKTVVPIHNAVNERAWSQILDWEKDTGSSKYSLSIQL